MNKINQFELTILKSAILGKNRAYLMAHPNLVLNQQQQKTLDELIKKREQGIPIAYLLGKREFWSLVFKVTEEVLIPRHETELIVEKVLEILPEKEIISLLELGTGSGAISIALAKERPRWKMTATDISEAALTIAKENAVNHQINTILFLESDWFSQIKHQSFHAIVSNPPYIAENNPHLSQGDLQFEPRLALVSGKEGLDAIRLIIAKAKDFLLENGWVFIEHGYDQASHIQAIFYECGFKKITTYNDISDIPRMTCAKVAR